VKGKNLDLCLAFSKVERSNKVFLFQTTEPLGAFIVKGKNKDPCSTFFKVEKSNYVFLHFFYILNVSVSHNVIG